MNQFQTDISLEEATSLFGAVPGRVNQQLAQKGFLSTSAPPVIKNGAGQEVPYNGWIPADLTALDDNGLGWYLGMLSGWLDYVQPQLAEAHSSMTAANNKLEFINAKLYMLHKRESGEGGKKRPEPERKAMVLQDRRYVEAQAEALYHETYYRYVQAIMKVAEQNYAAISRRISQRQQDIERQKRSAGVGNIGGPLFRQP